MSDDDDARKAEWETIRNERAAARSELVRAIGAVEARAKDPFGVKEKFRRNPALFAGLAAGVGAILVRLLVPGASRKREEAEEAEEAAARREECAARPADAASPIFTALRDAALRVATPWIARFVAEHLGEAVEPAREDKPPE